MKQKKRTPEELAEVVKEYIEKHPDTNRNKITKGTYISNTRLQILEDMGLVKLPAKLKKGSCSPTWRRWNKT
jgi:hypothetical protein